MKKLIGSVLLVSMLVMLTGCNKVDRTIATVNGEDIKASLYNFHLTNIKQQLKTPEGMDATEYWENTLIDGKHVADYAKEKATDEAIKLVLIAQKAREQGITLTAEDRQSIDQQKSNTRKEAGGTKEKYEKMLEGYGLTDITYGKMLEYTTYQNKLKEKMIAGYTEEQIKDFYDNNMVNVKHILFMTVDPSTGQNLPGQETTMKKEKAQEILEQIKNGADFDKLLEENNEDPGSPPTGYTISKFSNMVEPFLGSSLALQVGQVSDIVETNYGNHIIKRFEHKGNNEIFTAAQTEIQTGLFWQDVEAWKSESTISINQKEIDKIQLTN